MSVSSAPKWQTLALFVLIALLASVFRIIYSNVNSLWIVFRSTSQRV